MKQIMIMVALVFGMMATASAQSQKACCAGKEKTACAQKTAAKATATKTACCAKGDKASCSKAKGTAAAKTVSTEAGAAKATATKAACCAKGDKAACSKAKGTAAAKTVSAKADAATTTFKVYGVCGMCKRTIEGALNNTKGINNASWNVSSKMVTVTYDEKAISVDDMKAKIAAVGYDSDTHRAKDEVYNNLHTCCKYERPKGK